MTKRFSPFRGRSVRLAGVAAALLLSMCMASLPAFAADTAPPATTTASAPNILVGGVPAGSPQVQKIVADAWRQATANHAAGAGLNDAEWQQLLAAIDAALRQAGFAQAHAFRSDRVAVFAVQPSGAIAESTSTPATDTLPAVPGRETDAGLAQRIAVRGFALQGVGDHPKAGITPASIQQFANAALAKLGGGSARSVDLSFDQLQQVADAITDRYRKAGFIVATAYVPAQTVGKDDIVHIDVLEGEVGKITVQGTKHYRPWVIAAPAEKLRGKVLQKNAVDTALLYDRDLPGVSVTSTFQPGEKTGQTDLVMVAREKRPISVTVGANNYGTEVTGRYRADANVDWYNPLGIGDQLAVGINYAFDPHQNTYGSLTYSVPTVKVRGLSVVAGADRSELELNSGAFADLNVRGPTSRYFGGAEWKFINHTDLTMSGSLQYIHEQSSLGSLGYQLSDERFNLAQLGLTMQHTDRKFHGLDIASVVVRHSLSDDSATPDLVSPHHADSFSVAKLSYTRIQFLSPNQQLFFKFSGQYTNQALVPMEQFVIGGPDSVRAYPIADALRDRGYYAALEYHVNAPGFANKPSPFHGEPWGELLTLEGFVDYARGYPAGANTGNALTYSGAGAGFIFRLPRWHNLLFHLDGAVPLGSQKASDKNDYHIYGRFDLTF